MNLILRQVLIILCSELHILNGDHFVAVMCQACHLFLLNVLDEVRFLVGVETTATAGEALGVTALQMMAVLVSDSRNNIRFVVDVYITCCLRVNVERTSH